MNQRIASSDLEFIRCEIKARFIKRKIINKYASSNDPELREIADYLRHNAMSVFPYAFTKDYKIKDFNVEKDPTNDLFYYIKDGRRLYLRRGYKSKFRASRYMKNLSMEQDSRSPHCYTDNSFHPDKGSILLDVGGAEGIFAFQFIEDIKHAYIFECDPRWIEALKYTFKDHLEKITIVEKYVTNYNDADHITLDQFVSEYKLTDEKIFIKADCEGDEVHIIEGASELLKRKSGIKLALCTYHLQDHEQILRDRFASWNVSCTRGYLLYYYDFDFADPFVRRGVIRISGD
ncbi:MAG: hypothetical protein IK020_06790 [Clostridiales bacterium]|nr:hypothetical protein [Clostridiales bacterium]